jgi:hypothetical protein
VGVELCVQEDHCEAPDLDVQCGPQELFHGEGFEIAVVSVIVDAADNELAFSFVEETPGLVCAVREVDEEEEA